MVGLLLIFSKVKMIAIRPSLYHKFDCFIFKSIPSPFVGQVTELILPLASSRSEIYSCDKVVAILFISTLGKILWDPHVVEIHILFIL